jgi:hypothetical protein
MKHEIMSITHQKRKTKDMMRSKVNDVFNTNIALEKKRVQVLL